MSTSYHFYSIPTHPQPSNPLPSLLLHLHTFPKTRRAYFLPNTDVNNIYLEKSKRYLLRPELRFKYLISYSVFLSRQITFKWNILYPKYWHLLLRWSKSLITRLHSQKIKLVNLRPVQQWGFLACIFFLPRQSTQ